MNADVAASVKLAYADPPYLGSCRRYGHDHRPPFGCWDDLRTHHALIEYLAAYDGWALSCSTTSLRHLLPVCPEQVRVLAWTKPVVTFKKNVSPAYAWEPVLVKAARKPPTPAANAWAVPRDYLQVGTMHTGGKPLVFCRWVFSCMGADVGDSLDDLFHGSGAVKVAWEHYRHHLTLFDGDRPTAVRDTLIAGETL